MAEHPNQTLVRRGFEAFNAGDINTLSELIADDAVQVMPGSNPLAGEHKGRQAVLTMYGRLAQETEGTFRAELLDVYANDHLAVAIYRASGQRQGRSLDQRSALLFEIEHGQAVRLTDLPLDAAIVDAFLA